MTLLQLTKKHLLAHLININNNNDNNNNNNNNNHLIIMNIVETSSGKTSQKMFQKCHMVKANRKYSVIF